MQANKYKTQPIIRRLLAYSKAGRRGESVLNPNRSYCCAAVAAAVDRQYRTSFGPSKHHNKHDREKQAYVITLRYTLRVRYTLTAKKAFIYHSPWYIFFYVYLFIYFCSSHSHLHLRTSFSLSLSLSLCVYLCVFLSL